MVGKQHNILLWFRKTHKNDNERKQQFLQHKGDHSNNKEAYTDGSKSTERKVGFPDVFMYITTRETILKEASIHTAEITALRGKQKKEEIGHIYRLTELNADH